MPRCSFPTSTKAHGGFCAEQFPRARGIPSHEDFEQVDLPASIDVIFVGSVFTHLDRHRSQALWRKLFDALSPAGVLIPTFRGAACYRRMVRNSDRLNYKGYYDPLIRDYLTTGFGYQDYKNFTAWGQNLASIARVTDLAADEERGRLVGYKETGWAGVHNVAVWSKE